MATSSRQRLYQRKKRRTEQYRSWKNEYYQRHSYNPSVNRRFTSSDNLAILLHESRDVELAQSLKRSVMAIQIQRSRLKRLIRDRRRPLQDRAFMVGMSVQELEKFLHQSNPD
jgi:hypothetical protein